ncbi:MAG TPA: heavy metal-binding domain-containing protein [Vicinamibacterales bacterium]|nr:heavy metal-binding domain-containing protein [Vicinamibacterales bacterium]
MSRLGAICAGAGLLAAAGSASTALQPAGHEIVYTFHHLHVRVDDPGVVLDEVAARVNGTKAVLQGHGPAVRAGAEYVVLERTAVEDTTGGPPRGSVAEARYLEAVEWLRARGRVSDVQDDSVLRGGVPAGSVSTVAFVTPDVPASIAELRRAGSQPLEESEDGASYRLPSGLVVEIVAAEGPDAFWCPMHPGVRSPRQTRCPLCGMALVAIPPPRIGEYRLDVSIEREDDGRSTIRLRVRDPDSGGTVRDFVEVHERPFHLFLIGTDLERFAHVHPIQQADGSFELRDRIVPGGYMLLADFVPAGGTPQLLHRALATPGYAGPLFAATPVPQPGPREQIVEGVRIRLDAGDPIELKPARLVFTLSDAATDAPVTDLEPFLGASGHLLVVTPDLTAAIHGHPEGPATGGPAIVFDPVLPRTGRYKVWVQFQRAGHVVTAAFVIEAR